MRNSDAQSHLESNSPIPEQSATAPLRRTIPASGENIPAVGLGTWQAFDRQPPAPEQREVLKAFYELGGRLVDSSPMYGRAEALVGALSADLGLNQNLFLATKVWTRGAAAGEAQMRTSLELLGRRRLELMQVHNLVDWKTHLRTLRDWRERGLVRYLGITHYTAGALDDLAAVLRAERPDFVQLPYSVVTRAAERRLLPLARENGVAVLVNRPFEEGALFRAVAGRPVPDFAREFGAETWAQVFLKFILAQPAVTCVIPATANPRHLRDNMAAQIGPLPDAALCQKIIAAVKQ